MSSFENTKIKKWENDTLKNYVYKLSIFFVLLSIIMVFIAGPQIAEIESLVKNMQLSSAIKEPNAKIVDGIICEKFNDRYDRKLKEYIVVITSDNGIKEIPVSNDVFLSCMKEIGKPIDEVKRISYVIEKETSLFG